MFSATSVFNPKSFNPAASLKQEPSMHSLMQGPSGEILSTMGDNKQQVAFSPRGLPQQKSIMQFDLMETSIQKISLESKNHRENSPNGTIEDNLLQKSIEGLSQKRGSLEMHQVRLEPPMSLEQSRKLRLQQQLSSSGSSSIARQLLVCQFFS